MNKYKFYDTSSLLLLSDEELREHFVISSITLSELENIKTSRNKDYEVKVRARHIAHMLFELDNYEVQIFHPEMLSPIIDQQLEVNNDTKILACAIFWESCFAPDDMTFFTNDLCLFNIANLFFGDDSIEYVKPKEDVYKGYKEVVMNENEMTAFYMEPNNNCFNLLTNEYLIIRESGSNEVVARLCWTGTEYRHLNFNGFYSRQFGEIKPLKGDVHQMFAADSLNNNKITMLKGPAGSGKTMLSLGFLFHKLEKNKIDKIIVFCNTVATKGSAKLGFLPGSRDEKLLDSQIGILLASKLGDKMEVERLINDGKLVLLPFSDIRGFDTSGMKAGIYISEAQNLDIALMKLALQRIGEDSICIIDGDPLAQVDDESFAGHNNGMRRASKVFRGTEVYGEVELQTIHRSRIASIAQNM